MNREELISEYKKLSMNVKEKKMEILKQLDENKELIVSDNIIRDSNLCIFLSCPGEDELIEDCVCFGETGKNLEDILNIIKDKIPDIKSGTSSRNGNRYKYSIINSSNIVHFRAYNNAEPNATEIKNNVDNVIKELKSISELKYIIVAGDKAEYLYKQVVKKYVGILSIKYSTICHLGNIGIRNEYKNNYRINDTTILEDLNEEERDQKRKELLADRIVKELKTE